MPNNIYLKPLSKSNLSPFQKWINDPISIQYSLSLFSKLHTASEIESWFISLLSDTKNINLGIFISKTDELIGYTGICNISETNQSAEFFIFIGERSQWNKGYGSITTKLIIDLAFSKYNLNRLMLTVSEPNIGAIKTYNKAGFIQEGILRQACLRNGEFHNKIIMAILKQLTAQENLGLLIVKGI